MKIITNTLGKLMNLQINSHSIVILISDQYLFKNIYRVHSFNLQTLIQKFYNIFTNINFLNLQFQNLFYLNNQNPTFQECQDGRAV